MPGRRKLSGPAALATVGSGWTDMPNTRGLDPRDGPDVVLYLDDDETAGRFGDVTIRPAPRGEDDGE